MTIDEMAKLEQEHKDRIGNMTKEYERQCASRSADFLTESRRITEVINTKQAVLSEINKAIETNGMKKTELDVVVESLNAEIKAKTEANLALIQESADASVKYSDRRSWMEQNLDGMSRKLESIVSEIDLANRTLKHLDEEIVAKNDEAKKKGAEVAGYLAELAAVSKEAVAKKDALLAEMDDLAPQLKDGKDTLAALYAETETIAKRVDSTNADLIALNNAITTQKAKLEENKKEFKDLNALRSDVEAKQDDVKFREDQLLKRAKALNEQEARIKQLKG